MRLARDRAVTHNETMRAASRRGQLMVNLLAYYAGWAACVLSAAAGRWRAGAVCGLALVALHILCATRRGVELRLMITVTALGYGVDSMQTGLGLLVFDAGQPAAWLAPVWIGVMWMLFSTTLRYTFHWLAGRYLLAAAFGLIGGPAAFYAGERLGAVAFHPTPGLSLTVLALVWAALFPLLTAIAATIGGTEGGRYRWVR